jgi:multisubunit Na+/H+ antiporter MnhE subunit
VEPDQRLLGEQPQPSPAEPSASIILEKTECRVVPDETARFPFVVRSDQDIQSIHYLDVVSDNTNFNRDWAHIVGTDEGAAFLRRYILEIRPTRISRHQYGRYPLLVTWSVPGTRQHLGSRCVLVVKPCVCLKAEPVLAVRPAGQLSLSLENCGNSSIDVTVTLSHHGASWSKGWEFELGTEDGPFEFSEQFDLPLNARKGEFDLDISAEGVSVAQLSVRPRRFFIARKHIAAAAVALAGIVAAIGFTLIGSGTALHPQVIAFTSSLSGSAAPGDTYRVTATGGGSGNPITFSIDPASAAVCSISGATVTFSRPGTCTIDANQAGNASYQAAAEAQQTATVTDTHVGPLAQQITFTSTPPPSPAPGDTYRVTADGGGSGNPIILSIDPASASVCSISGATVTFSRPGTCTIDANQAGNASYQAAAQAQQTATVAAARGELAQHITFTSTPPASAAPGSTYQVTATGGGSGNPVTFDSATVSVCSMKGSMVTFNEAGTCVIEANQAGNERYQAAPQALQTMTVQQIPQTITFSSTLPTFVVQNGTYVVAATGGGSDNMVIFTIDPASDLASGWVCSISGATVTFNQPGTCTIDANQAGNASYQAAPQAQQSTTVEPVIQ